MSIIETMKLDEDDHDDILIVKVVLESNDSQRIVHFDEILFGSLNVSCLLLMMRGVVVRGASLMLITNVSLMIEINE